MALRLRFRRPTRAPRGTPAWVFLLALVILVSIVSGVPYFVAGDDARRPEQVLVPTELTLSTSAMASLKEATVIEVIDGDTIDVKLDGKPARIRYFGIDTPERGDRCYREAADRNQTLVGSRVLLLPDARDMDSFGRLLRYVFLPDGTSVDATLVAEGYAQAWRQDGSYRDQIIALEDQARTADRGCLWE